MRDRVFIIWSGDNSVAKKVKDTLEKTHDYICVIGGNDDNDSENASVSDTVIQQMCECNQAIIIFQNKNESGVSRNLFFELGYTYASYGPTKIHCVKRKEDNIALPSDFDNGFVEPIKCADTDDSFAEGIIKYFMARQKMSVVENKMSLIDNRYKIHEKISSHYSKSGSKCSDYELAQYILYYMQAAQMFNDIPRISKEIEEFRSRNKDYFSTDLEIAVSICSAFFEFCQNIHDYEDDHNVYVEEKTLFELKQKYKNSMRKLKSEKSEIFDKWARTFINEYLNFAYMLYGNNINISEEKRAKAYENSIKHGIISLENVKELENLEETKKNYDNRGLLSLFRAYITRNLYICKKYLNGLGHEGHEDYVDYIKQSVDERESLKNRYEKGAIDSQIYDNFCMEYYLALTSYIDESCDEDFDDDDIDMCKNEMREYLDQMEKNNKSTSYLERIRFWVDN